MLTMKGIMLTILSFSLCTITPSCDFLSFKAGNPKHIDNIDLVLIKQSRVHTAFICFAFYELYFISLPMESRNS